MKGYNIALNHLGLHERKDNAKIREFLASAGHGNDIDPQYTPWCAAFMNACEVAVGNKGTSLLNARSYLKYGYEVSGLEMAVQGDILVFARGNDGWQGHVTYLDKVIGDPEDDDCMVRCLGGNQNDSVSFGNLAADRLLGIRRSF